MSRSTISYKVGKSVLGIDPGNTGAIAFYDGTHLECWDMPTTTTRSSGKNRTKLSAGMLADRFWQIQHQAPDVVAYVELVSSSPQQGVTSSFVFGKGAGIIEGALAGVGIPCTLVTPQSWKKAMGLPAGSDKDASRARAAALLPRFANLFARKKDDGRAEAALLAIFGYKQQR